MYTSCAFARAARRYNRNHRFSNQRYISLQVPRSLEADTFPTRAYRVTSPRYMRVEYKWNSMLRFLAFAATSSVRRTARSDFPNQSLRDTAVGGDE